MTIVGLTGPVTLCVLTSNGEPVPAEAMQPVRGVRPEPRTLDDLECERVPEQPPLYRMTRAFPKVSFTEALELTAVPGKKAWVVAERGGKILSFANDASTTEAKLVFDVKHTIYGVILHPKFQENGLIYVSEVPDGDKETPDGTRVVRYTVADREKMTADPKSAKLIFSWPNGGHNGGCLRFGPDGYLYISTGDGSGIADGLESGQDLSVVLGKLLRIDVDKEEDGKAYAIPKDTRDRGRRGEIWAYGIRGAGRSALITATGDLWAGSRTGSVEMVWQIEKGRHHG